MTDELKRPFLRHKAEGILIYCLSQVIVILSLYEIIVKLRLNVKEYMFLYDYIEQYNLGKMVKLS